MKIGKWTPIEDPDEVKPKGYISVICECGRRECVLKQTYQNGKGCMACKLKERKKKMNGAPSERVFKVPKRIQFYGN